MTPAAQRAIDRLLEQVRTEFPYTHPDVVATIAGRLARLPDLPPAPRPLPEDGMDRSKRPLVDYSGVDR